MFTRAWLQTRLYSNRRHHQAGLHTKLHKTRAQWDNTVSTAMQVCTFELLGVGVFALFPRKYTAS